MDRYLFIFGCAGTWLLSAALSSCGEQGSPLLVGRRPVISVTSLALDAWAQ